MGQLMQSTINSLSGLVVKYVSAL